MLALDLGQHTRTVKPIVEVRVQMVGLMSEHCTKRTAIGRESPVPLVHVVAVSDCGGDGAVRVGGDARLNTGPILPICGGTPGAKSSCSLSILMGYEGKNRFFHISGIRGGERGV